MVVLLALPGARAGQDQVGEHGHPAKSAKVVPSSGSASTSTTSSRTTSRSTRATRSASCPSGSTRSTSRPRGGDDAAADLAERREGQRPQRRRRLARSGSTARTRSGFNPELLPPGTFGKKRSPTTAPSASPAACRSREKLKPVTVTFKKTGSFTYYCNIHAGHEGHGHASRPRASAVPSDERRQEGPQPPGRAQPEGRQGAPEGDRRRPTPSTSASPASTARSCSRSCRAR